MNKLALSIVVFATTVCAFAQDAKVTEEEVRAQEVRNKIVGTWKMVSTEQTLKDGSKRPYPMYGPHGQGFLMYQSDGYMCADLVNPDRAKWAAGSSWHVSAAEAEAAGRGTFAYCGRYQVRPYRLDGNRMILSDAVTKDPEVVRWTIVWEKVSGAN